MTRRMLTRRALPLAAAGAALLPGAARLRAQPASPGAGNWPRDRPIRIIITYPPGGTTDFVARIFATRLSEQLGQSVVVDNRPGGGGVIGWTAGTRAPADGYTLLLTENSLATAPPLHPNLGFDVRTDLSPVSLLVDYPSVFVVPASLPVRTLDEFIAHARARRDEVFYGSMGAGSSPHLYTELMQDLADFRVTHVPYRGMGPAFTDLLAGRVSLLIAAPPTVLGAVRAGQARVIAIGTSGERIPALPDVPTVKELGYDFTYSFWYGLFGPRGLDDDIVLRLQQEVARVLDIPEVRQRFIEQGAVPVGGDGEMLRRAVEGDLTRWSEVIRAKGITLQQ